MKSAVIFVPAIFFIACSSGGEGTIKLPGVSGFGNESAGAPALPPVPTTGTPGTGNGPHDSGVVNEDTGGQNNDTGTTTVDTGTGSSGDDAICAAKCPSDGDVPAANITACKNAMNGTKCAAEYRAWFTCRSEKRVCASDGTTDTTATSAACMSETNALTACSMAP